MRRDVIWLRDISQKEPKMKCLFVLGFSFASISCGHSSFQSNTQLSKEATSTINISPEVASMRLDEKLQLSAQGVTNLGKEVDITEDAIWQVDDKSSLILDPQIKGQITAFRTGEGKLTVTYEKGSKEITIQVVGKPKINFSGKDDVKVAEVASYGETRLQIQIANLKEGDFVQKIYLRIHSVDIEVKSFTLGEVAAAQTPGWFSQAATVILAFKQTSHRSAKYKGQLLAASIKTAGNETLEATGAFVFTNTNESGIDPDIEFEGTAGAPSALPKGPFTF